MGQYVQLNHQALSANTSGVTATVDSAGCHQAADGSSVVGRPFVTGDGSKFFSLFFSEMCLAVTNQPPPLPHRLISSLVSEPLRSRIHPRESLPSPFFFLSLSHTEQPSRSQNRSPLVFWLLRYVLVIVAMAKRGDKNHVCVIYQ